MWKINSFQTLWDIDRLLVKEPSTLLNLIVVGDSDYEINAGKHFRQNMKHGRKCLVKLVKFREEPTSFEIEKQLMILVKKFE